jgi:hypothetical protein
MKKKWLLNDSKSVTTAEKHGAGGGGVNVIWSHETLHKSPNVVVQRLRLLILNIKEIMGKDSGILNNLRRFPECRKANTDTLYRNTLLCFHVLYNASFTTITTFDINHLRNLNKNK